MSLRRSMKKNPRHSEHPSSYLNGFASQPPPCLRSPGLQPESSKLYYWNSSSVGPPPGPNGVHHESDVMLTAVKGGGRQGTQPPPPNFRLNFVKKMEDSLILRLPQGSCDTTPDTPDSLDDDSVDQTSLPPTPLPIPVSDLPLPKPPNSPGVGQKPADSPDPWLMRENLIEEINAPPNAVCSSASSPATPVGSPQTQTRGILRSISQIRLHNTHNNHQSLLQLHKPSLAKEMSSEGSKSRIYSSLYPQMVSNNSSEKNNTTQFGARNDSNNNTSFDRTLKSHQTTLLTTTTTTKVIKSSTSLDEAPGLKNHRKKILPPPAASSTTRYATIGASSGKLKRSAIVNNNNRIINANLSSTTLHCTSSTLSRGETSSSSSVLLPLHPPPYQDPPKYRKPRTTLSMENNPAQSSSSCFTIDSAMNSINNNNQQLIPDKTEENAILKDLQRHMSYELLENPRHLTSDEEEEVIDNHVEADVRVTAASSVLQIKSKSLPTIARVQQQNQLTNGHVYKLQGAEEEAPLETPGIDPIQERLRNDSLSTLNEVNSSKIANLSSGSSSLINKLRSDTNRDQLDSLQRNNVLDFDHGGNTAKPPGRNRVDSIVDRDLLEGKDERQRKVHNGNLISRESESCRLSSTEDDFESTDEEHLRSHHTHHRKYRRKRSSLSNPDSIEETDDDELDDDIDHGTEDPEMEMCDPCQCYGKCCLDMVASIFCVSLL